MRVLAISNQKGGCGKTTSSINLGASLAFLGKKVLLVDLDPQAHSTIGLGVEADQLERSMFDVLNPQSASKPSLQDITIHVEKNLWLAPAQIVLSAIEQQLAGLPKREEQLAIVITTVKKNYDFVLIDCPPNLGLLTFNALRAASEVVITIEPSTFSIHGLDKINETIQVLKDQVNHHLIVHALLTMYDHRKRFIREVVEQARILYGRQVFRTVIRSNIRLREAAQAGRPITRFDRHSTGFHDYLSLATEIIERGLAQQKLDATAVKQGEQNLDTVIQSGGASIEEELEESVPEQPAISEEEDEEWDEQQLAGIGPEKNAGAKWVQDGEIRDRFDDDAGVSNPVGMASGKSDVGQLPDEKAELGTASEMSTSDESLGTSIRDRETLEELKGREEGKKTSPLEVIKGIRKYPLKVSGGFLFICKCPRAKSVAIVGDFTNWVPVNMNSPGGHSGFWTRVFTLEGGKYKYKYIVDGEWVMDVNNEHYERNPYGGVDSVLEVGS